MNTVLVPLLSDLDRYTLIHLHHKFLRGVHMQTFEAAVLSPLGMEMHNVSQVTDKLYMPILSAQATYRLTPAVSHRSCM